MADHTLQHRAPDIELGKQIEESGTSTDDWKSLILRSPDGIPWSRWHLENTGSSNLLAYQVLQFIDPDAEVGVDTPVATDSGTVSANSDASAHLDELVSCVALRWKSDSTGNPTDFTARLLARREG